MLLNKKAVNTVFFSSVLLSTLVLADIGSVHQDMAEKRRLHNEDQALAPQLTFSKRNSLEFDEISAIVDALHQGAVEDHLGAHVEQADLEAMPAFDAYVHAFEAGDELFEIDYNALDGAGVNVGNGKRFSSVPRLDLDAGKQWANVLPHRITGPNGTSCIQCHNRPVADGGGGVNDNVIRIDPERRQAGLIERQSPHMFGMGAVQLVAQEMTSELKSQRDAAIAESCDSRRSVWASLSSKGVSFGHIRASCTSVNYRRLRGVDSDLIVKPYEWKGLTASVRDFVRGAAHQELGMQAVELVGDVDSDFDSINNELSVGDITSLAIYAAAQPRPVTTLELNAVISQLTDEEVETYGLPLSTAEIASITNGERVFDDLGCASCHTPAMLVTNTVFAEPSIHADYKDDIFPAGDQVNTPSVAIQFDLTSEILDNAIALPSGQTLGQFERTQDGSAIVRMYGDLKRHYMGRALAEDFDEGSVGAATFLTENLWGVGSTPPYLHDGRATTVTEAILYHGGEGSSSKRRFVAASANDQADLVAFLENLVVYLQ